MFKRDEVFPREIYIKLFGQIEKKNQRNQMPPFFLGVEPRFMNNN